MKRCKDSATFLMYYTTAKNTPRVSINNYSRRVFYEFLVNTTILILDTLPDEWDITGKAFGFEKELPEVFTPFNAPTAAKMKDDICTVILPDKTSFIILRLPKH